MNLEAVNSVCMRRKALRFAFSGLLVTVLHVVIASVFIENILPVPSLANGVAFVMATVISYLINTTWTFSTQLYRQNLFRFCVVSFFGFSLAVSISGAAQFYGMHYWYGIVFVVCAVPPVTFLLHNFWTYR